MALRASAGSNSRLAQTLALFILILVQNQFTSRALAEPQTICGLMAVDNHPPIGIGVFQASQSWTSIVFPSGYVIRRIGDSDNSAAKGDLVISAIATASA